MKSVIGHAVLAVIALAGAYYVWTKGPEAEGAAEAVTLLECSKTTLSRIALTTERRTTELTRRVEDDKPVFEIAVTPKAGSTDPEGARRFVANEALDGWLRDNLPLRALRSLGEVPRDRLHELELDAPKSTLSVACGSRTVELSIGGSAYGSGERYARLKSGGPVVLLAPAVVADMDAAESRFMQRELHRFPLSEVDEVRVEVAGQRRALTQRNRHSNETREWVDAAAPDRRNELFGNWLDRVASLRASKYYARGAEPGTGGSASAVVTPVATLEYRGDGDVRGKLELVRIDGDQGPEYAARTETTRVWVTVVTSVAQQVEQDARSVVGLEPAPAPSPAPAQSPAPIQSPAPTQPPAPTQSPASIQSPAPGGTRHPPATH